MNKTQYYQDQLDRGLEYQDFICDQLWIKENRLIQYTTSKKRQYTSETRQGVEIKFDDQLKKTGNLYLEFKERTSSDIKGWTPSGFMKLNDNTYEIIIGNYEMCFYFYKSALQELRKKYLMGSPELHNSNIRIVETATSQGIVIPINDPIMNIICGKKIIF